MAVVNLVRSENFVSGVVVLLVLMAGCNHTFRWLASSGNLNDAEFQSLAGGAIAKSFNAVNVTRLTVGRGIANTGKVCPQTVEPHCIAGTRVVSLIAGTEP